MAETGIYPCKQALRPVDKNDPPIKPTQVIAHVAVVPVYPGISAGPGFHDGLDWHFFIDYGPGDPWDIITQLRNTHIQADANFLANGPRADGSGAISFESEGDGNNAWSPWQVQAIIWLCRQANKLDGVPLRICRTDSDPGLGYHRLFNQWNKPYHSCPGDAKVEQFRNIIIPALSVPEVTPTPKKKRNMNPVFCRDKSNRLWRFVIGKDGACWATVDDAPAFTLGGSFLSGLTAELLSDNRMIIGAQGQDNWLWECVSVNDEPNWTGAQWYQNSKMLIQAP